MLSQPTADDLQIGYVSSDGSRRELHRFCCLICGVDLGRCRRRTKSKLGQHLDPTSAAKTNGISTFPRCTVSAPTCGSRLRVSRSGGRTRSSSRQQQVSRHLLKTGRACDGPGAVTVDVGLLTDPSWKQNGLSCHHRRQHRTLGRSESELVSLSHFYRRHQHRARNHSRAMRQVAEWIENSGKIADSAADDTAIVRPRHHHHRRHVHEHYHHHYHYHYSAGALV